MKKIIISIISLVIFPSIAFAQFTTVQGGTGLSTYSQGDIIYAGSTNPIRFTKLNIGLSGTCLTSSGSIPNWGLCPSFPFVPVAGGNSTTSPIYFYGGLYSLGSSTIQFASTTVISAQTICFLSDTCRTTWPSGGGGSGNVSTSTTESPGTLAYWTSNASTPALLGKVSTTTLSGSGMVSVTAGAVVIGNSPITVSCSTCGTGSVTSIATNNGLTGGTITTTGTLGFDLTHLPVNNLVLTYNGSQLQATGTPTLTAGNYIATTTIASQFPNATTTQLTLNGPLYDSTNSAGTSGQVLTSQGANTAPHWAASGGGSGKTVDYIAAFTSLDSSTPNAATTTSIQNGGELWIQAACDLVPGTSGVAVRQLDVSNPGGGSTTVAIAYQVSANNLYYSIPGYYTASSTGKVTIAIDTDKNTVQACEHVTIQYTRYTN